MIGLGVVDICERKDKGCDEGAGVGNGEGVSCLIVWRVLQYRNIPRAHSRAHTESRGIFRES